MTFSSLTGLWNRVLQLLGRASMYRLTLCALAALTVIALVLSVFGLVSPQPLELVATLVVLMAAGVAVDSVAQRALRLPHRYESSLITGGILLFVLRPTLEPAGLAGIALAAAAASVSKYVLAWRGRHVFNPAAIGATALTLLSVAWPDLGASAWWVGSSALAAPVAIAGLIVLWRTEKLRMVAVFLVVAVGVAVFRLAAQLQAAGAVVDSGQLLSLALWSSPVLFLGAFMLPEPLTQPPRRWQQLVVAAFVGVLVGWPIDAGPVTLGQERALLVGNLLAFAFALRTAVRVTLEKRSDATATVRRLTFRASRPVRFVAGQYLELDVPHPHPDARGTRREFSIVSAPEDLPVIEIAFREAAASAPEHPAPAPEHPAPAPELVEGPPHPAPKPSSYKRALAQVQPGDRLAVTGVWGDFVLPRRELAPVLMVAAGIGVTPFVGQLRHMTLAREDRDVVLVYVASSASELAFRADIEASGIPVVVFTRDRPAALRSNWVWAEGVRLDAEGLARVVPDIDARHAYASGPAGLLADLAPALAKARSVTTDAFSGY
ncbi:MAG: flavodoxin reductase [Microbacterium sp.]|uniref:FAD-dependent oxidoreductase n=1 Tax=Microbacterium sp. TaxID=51671 RepID=UPI0039E2AE0C